MILRVILENILSFKEETEINMFAGNIKSKSNHKHKSKNLEWLKVSAIYGANGAGKSNIVEVLNFLKDIVMTGQLEYPPKHFRLNNKYPENKQSRIDIEFFHKNIFFYYEILFIDNEVSKEILWKNSNEKKPSKIFERINKNKSIKIQVNTEYIKNDTDRIRINILEEDVIESSNLVISNITLRKAIKEISIAYEWITANLIIISPEAQFMLLVYRLIVDKKFNSYFNELLPLLDTGIKRIQIKESPLDSYFGEDNKEDADRVKYELDNNKGDGFASVDTDRGQLIAIKRNKKYYINHLQLFHNCDNRKNQPDQPFEIFEESDGTKRLFDLMPMVYSLLVEGGTFVVDEIERSIHPILIKELLKKLLQQKLKGQLIFTTHESSLLDLDIFRQDEIWLTQKDSDGATKLYPLSDFKPRFDLDIRKGYLNGRFGAIPFLGNLKDLKWDSL